MFDSVSLVLYIIHTSFLLCMNAPFIFLIDHFDHLFNTPMVVNDIQVLNTDY